MKTNDEQDIGPFRYALPSARWIVQTLVIFGIASTWMFIKINLGEDFSMEIPEVPVLRKR